MEIDFLKLYCGPNDLIFINFTRDIPLSPDLFGDLAKDICRRHLGVGGNGVLFAVPGKDAEIKLHYYLPDGQEGNILNDALICLSRYFFDHGCFDRSRLTVETSQGLRTIQALDSSNFSIMIGPPHQIETRAELIESPHQEWNQPIRIDNKTLPLTPLNLGLDGVVFFYQSYNPDKLRELSAKIRSALADKYSVQPIMACVTRQDEIIMQTWFKEHIVDFSACAGMALTAAVLNGFTDREAVVKLGSFPYFIQWLDDNNIYVTSASDYVFSGLYDFYL